MNATSQHQQRALLTELRRPANRCRRGGVLWLRAAQKPQPVEQEAEVVADGGEHGVVGAELEAEERDQS